MSASKSSDQKLTDNEGGIVKNSKKKQKKQDAWRQEGPKDVFAMLDSLPEKKQQEIQKALHLFSWGPNFPRTLEQAKKRTYKFWDTQPVPKLVDTITTHGQIEDGDASAREEPYPLPQGFSWDTLDLSSPSVLRELCTLLNNNYLEDDDNTIRYDFSPEYMQWALQPPNETVHWHCGVRVVSSKKLVGFIDAVPANVRIYETEKRMVQVKFLCVHKKLRLKRMTPVLIRELSRRVNQQGLNQAVYTAAIVLPTPISSCRNWHRPLNHRKLMDVNHPDLRRDMTPQRVLRFYHLPEVTKTPGLRPMTKKDVAGIHSLLQENLSKFQLSPIFSLQEVEHWLLPRENVIDTYVVQGEDGTLTDVVCFYSTTFKVLNHAVHASLRAAHLLYVITTTVNQDDLMEDTLVLAKSKGFDIFTAVDVMNNKSFLEKLKFNITSKSLHYYLYNWMCPNMSPNKVGFVFPN